MSISALKTYYQFPNTVKVEFKMLPWLQLFIYLPFVLQPFSLQSLAIVITCHLPILLISFKAYWVNNSQVTQLFILSLCICFIASFYSTASIGLFAITVMIGGAHRIFNVRLLLISLLTGVYLLSAWLQQYSLTTFLIGLFFTLVHGINVCYSVQTLYQKNAVNKSQEEASSIATAQERERIANDLHDLLGQSLTGISLKAELANKVFDSDPKLAKAQISEIIAISRKTLNEVREAVLGYRKSSIEHELMNARLGLGALNIQFICETIDIPLNEQVEQTLAWIIREATTNVMRHSQAKKCHLSLSQLNNSITLIIKDNGIGNVESTTSIIGSGLDSIKQRCRVINAECSIRSSQGFEIKIEKVLT